MKVGLPAETTGDDVLTAFYPTYDAVRALLPVLAGMPRVLVTGMRAAIWEHRGTVTANVDWTEPDRWIPERLTGDFREAALRIWQGTEHAVNPRHMTGHWYVANGHELLADDANGRLALSARGRAFIGGDEEIVRLVDEREGLLELLAIMAEHGPARLGGLFAPWMRFVERVSRIRTASSGRNRLFWRLRNMVGRGYVAHVGQQYEITPAGLAWLKGSGYAEQKTIAPDETRQLWDLVQATRDAVRQGLRQRLAAMTPYAFEQLVGRLLQEMDYTDVEVTAASGDKGVDVVGRIALGITEVREVIQVKRQQGNVQRPVLDMLRGSLHRFAAVKGTIITLGGFAKGAQQAAFEPGAAPITLIDGEKLLDLLIEHGVGVRTKTVELLELDADDLTSVSDSADSAAG